MSDTPQVADGQRPDQADSVSGESATLRAEAGEPARVAAIPVEPGMSADELRERLASLQTRLDSQEAALETITKQLSFLPAQVRLLGNKVDALTTSISEPRYRAALLSLFGIYDLVEQVLRTLPATPENDAGIDQRRNYEVVRTQLRQILEANGLCEIPADGQFNPDVHRAVQRVPCTDPAQDNRIVQVVRSGFRTEQTPLRYAEVIVSRYAPTEGAGN